MRDPWFPIALMLVVVLTVWLGIAGPMPKGVTAWVHEWQTLIAAGVASIAAAVAFQNTNRSLRHTERLEKHRRTRKHAALRALLPIPLAQMTNYSERSAFTLNELIEKCSGELLPAMTAPTDLHQPLSSDTLKALVEFIEYSDTVDVNVVETTLALIQIHDSRLRDLVRTNRDVANPRSVPKLEIESLLIDAASIYAGASAVFDYARRRRSDLPCFISWNDVRKAMRNMRFWDEECTRLYENLDRHEKVSAGPLQPEY